MAFRALHGGMLVQQRKFCRGMQSNRENRGFKSFDQVARATLPLVRALGKLSLVVILFMAIHAVGECHGSLEIARHVTLFAGDGPVLSLERILRGSVVERCGDFGRLPVLRGMTGTAGSLECASMRIIVAWSAVLKCDVFVPHVRFRVVDLGVAFLAACSLMSAGECEARAAVIELGRVLPALGVVAG